MTGRSLFNIVGRDLHIQRGTSRAGLAGGDDDAANRPRG
jgi:hypothetical protein